jgi:hypothetical protein
LPAEVLPDFFHADHDSDISAVDWRGIIRGSDRPVDCKLACHTRVP